MFKTILVGCGLIAQVKHLPAIQTLRNEIQLVGVCDTNASLAKQLATQYKIPQTYASLTEALSAEQPDLVILCTPPQTHKALSLEALEGGAHLFLEKPMALTVAEATAIIEAAKRNKKEVCVAFSQTFTPVVQQAKQLLVRDLIGPLVGMQIFLSTPTDYMTNKPKHWVHRLPSGVLSETGPHVVHMTMQFLGKIRETQIRAFKGEAHSWSLPKTSGFFCLQNKETVP